MIISMEICPFLAISKRTRILKMIMIITDLKNHNHLRFFS